MKDDFDTPLVEFCCPVANKDDAENPVQELETYLNEQDRDFAIDEHVIPKAELIADKDWAEWFAEHPKEKEVYIAVFMIRKIDSKYFEKLLESFAEENLE